MAKKVIMLLILATVTLYASLMCFEKMPWSIILAGFFAQGLHAAIIRSFPFVQISSPEFILAVIMVLVNHFLAFRFFSLNYYPLTEVLAYFTLCLWIVPFALFVSLSANDQVLPTTMSSEQSSSMGKFSIIRLALVTLNELIYYSCRWKRRSNELLFKEEEIQSLVLIELRQRLSAPSAGQEGLLGTIK